MSMELTDYTIERTDNHYKIYKANTLIAHSVLVDNSALHAIHTLNGSVENHWYEEIDGKVYLRIEDGK